MPKEGFAYRIRDNERFVGIGVENAKSHLNTGIIFRTAVCMGLGDFLFTCGDIKYSRPHSDTAKSTLTLPTFHYKDFDDLFEHLPMNSILVGVELCERSIPIEKFEVPPRVVYLFGGEEVGLSKQAQKSCRHIIKLPSVGTSMNLASSASMVMYNHWLQSQKGLNG